MNRALVFLILVLAFGCKPKGKETTPDPKKGTTAGPRSSKDATSLSSEDRTPATTPPPKKAMAESESGDDSARAHRTAEAGGYGGQGKLTPTERKAFIKGITDGYYGRHIKRSFYKTNEKRHDLFIPHIKNLGGAYLGVAADHNYTFAVHAGSRLVILMDYDRNIVALHKMYSCLVAAEPTVAGFLKWFTYKKIPYKKYREKNKRFEALMGKCYGAATVAHIMRIKRGNKRFFPWWHQTVIRRGRKLKYDTWLSNDSMYGKWRKLVTEGRVVAVLGDLTKAVSMARVSSFLKRAKLPMGLIYFSNAEEYWGHYTKPFRKAMINLPFKKNGLVLRGTFMGGGKGQADNLYHYSIQKIGDFVSWMRQKKWISGSFMVNVGKKYLKKHYFSQILGPTPAVMARYERRVRRSRRRRRRRLKVAPPKDLLGEP